MAFYGPLSLLYNEFAIVVGLVYGYLPLMVLPLYAAIERLPREVRRPLRTWARATGGASSRSRCR